MKDITIYNIAATGSIRYVELPTGFRRLITCVSFLLFLSLVIFTFFAVRTHIVRTIPTSNYENEIGGYEAESMQEHKIVTVRSGDNLKSILIKQNISDAELNNILKLDVIKAIALSLKKGQKITFDYDLTIIENEDSDLTTEVRNLNRMVIALDKLSFIEVIKVDGQFFGKNTVIPLQKFITKSSATINKSFISALKELGLSANNINDLVNAYSHQVDFQRQIQIGDTVTVITEQFKTESGQFSHHGNVIYACLKLTDKEYPLYNYSVDGAKSSSFFSPEGKSVKRSLLRTPLNLVRISSHYGNRAHPISGFTKMHKGIDFAAPDGTPIYAAGDGVVTELGMKSGYGRFIQIKHSANLSTAYAHASKFAANLKVGDKVKQGKIIAYVGHSGNTTGSHLHYEVKVAGKNVNPISIKTTPGIELSASKLVAFKKHQDTIKSLSKKLDHSSHLLLSDNNRFEQ